MQQALLQEVRTMCPMNCHPTFCGMIASIENDSVIKVRGDRENPDSQGFLCARGQATKEIIGNPNRILRPMIRDQRGTDNWKQVSWEQAMEKIAGSIKAVDPDSVVIWPGHGAIANDYGTFAHAELALRLACLYGMQVWEPSMICWGLGGFGIGLTGPVETNTKEDMGKNSDMIILWGANFASQPNTARHVSAAKSRGATVITVDVRMTEACKSADDVFIVKPGTDAALALAMMHVIVAEDLCDMDFIRQHTIGFEPLQAQLQSSSPAWAESITGIQAERITALARVYAKTDRAMIILGGSSMYKDQHGWQASRAISCLPPLTGKLGKPGTGFGPRHAARSHGFNLQHIVDFESRPDGRYIPSQMSAIINAFESGRIRAFLMFGTNALSSFADAGRMARGMEKMDLLVHHDLFMSDTARRYADVVLPATSWLEDVGVKSTPTHLYLMDRMLEPAGEARSMSTVVRELAELLGVKNFYPWEGEFGHIDAVMNDPSTGHATIDSLRKQGGTVELNISHVAHIDHSYTTPSGKIEFYSERAEQVGLPPLPGYQERPVDQYPLELRSGRTLTHFHAFYDHGRALPAMAKLEKGPVLWISPADARQRNLVDGIRIRIHNKRGACEARARITEDVLPGTVWMHDGWQEMNTLTSGEESLPDEATTMFPFTVGQAAYDARVEVSVMQE